MSKRDAAMTSRRSFLAPRNGTSTEYNWGKKKVLRPTEFLYAL